MQSYWSLWYPPESELLVVSGVALVVGDLRALLPVAAVRGELSGGWGSIPGDLIPDNHASALTQLEPNANVDDKQNRLHK
jgi:hypothetical protein